MSCPEYDIGDIRKSGQTGRLADGQPPVIYCVGAGQRWNRAVGSLAPMVGGGGFA
jgi:hypothetical protein